MEGTDIQSAFVGSNSTEILDRGRVSSVAHNNYNELEKLLFKHKRFYLKPYELDYSQTEAKKSPPTATRWAKQLRTVLDKTKEENQDLKGWFVIPAWDAQVVAAPFGMLGSTSALFLLLPYISSVIRIHGAQLRDAYKVRKDGKDSYEFCTSGHQTMPCVALLLNTSSFDGCRYEDIHFKFEPFRFATKHARRTEAGSDPRGHLWVTWGVYLCAGKPPLADIILYHPPDLTRCDSVIGLAIPAMSGHIQYRGAAS